MSNDMEPPLNDHMEQQLCVLLEKLPNYGLFMLSAREAAQISIVDMCRSNLHFIDLYKEKRAKIRRKNFSPDFWRNKDIVDILSNEIEMFLKKIIHAIEQKRLYATKITRTPNDKINPDRTFIHYKELINWLEEYGYKGGKTFTEFKNRENDIQFFICEEIEHIRIAERLNKAQEILDSYSVYWGGGAEGESDLYNRWKAAVLENDRLIEELENKQPYKNGGPHKSTSASGDEKNRRTILTIMAAICDHAHIEYHKSGTAQIIEKATETLGARVSAETIKKTFRAIPDAVESRRP